MPSPSAAIEVQAYLPLSPRDYLVLLALVDGPAHGYGILKAIESGSGGVPFDPANLYRSLRKLSRDGLVLEAAVRERHTAGGPGRRYRLTSLGRRVLTAEAQRLAWLTDAARARHLVSPS
jgi:DNA-binding PadR family transcriptional regulator